MKDNCIFQNRNIQWAECHCFTFLQNSFSLSCDVFVFSKNFIYFISWLCWIFVASSGLSLVAASRGYSSLWRSGFSLWWLLLLWRTGSRHLVFCITQAHSSRGSQALEHGLSRCGAQGSLLRGIGNLPGPGIEPLSSAVAGRFLSSVPPEKSTDLFQFSSVQSLSRVRLFMTP